MSIFERLQPRVDLTVEYLKLDKAICNEKDRYGTTINGILAQNFRSWKYRGNYMSLQELRGELGLNIENFEPVSGYVYKQINENDFFLFCELFSNLCDAFAEKIEHAGFTENFIDIFTTMQTDLAVLNYSVQRLLDGRLVIVETNPAATAVSKTAEPDLSDKIIEYNHYLLRGDLAKKREILRALSHKFDAIKSSLKSINSGLEDKASFLLNNLNIRHNNKDMQSKDYRKFVDDMSDDDLEHWYDETYQTLLFAILAVDQVARNQAIDELKTKSRKPREI
ncbi:MAG: hypothetical protein VB068_09935 [Petrimonas sp.]|nr:hypothetical protein [Petrimonas sp.]